MLKRAFIIALAACVSMAAVATAAPQAKPALPNIVVLATGGTLVAARDLLAAAGADVTEAAVVMELAGLGGRDRLAPLAVRSLQLL